MTIDPQQPKTITSFADSSKQLSRQTAPVDPAKNAMIAAALVRLASHYHRPDFGPEQAKYMALDFIQDLQPFTMAEIENGIRDYRREAKNKFFPTPGQLLQVMAANRKHVVQLDAYRPLKPEFGTPRPICWWMQAKQLWKPEWSETQVPAGELVRDVAGGPLREPRR